MIIDKEPNYYRYAGILLIIGFLIFYSPIPKWFTQKPQINTTVTIIEKEVKVYITPIPDNKNYFANEYTSGLRLIKMPFTWIRNNAIGKQDMRVSVRIYDYMLFEKIHWWNPNIGKYNEQYPEDNHNQFLFLFINIEMDNTVADDTRLWLPDKNKFAIQSNGIVYYSKNYPEQLRIKELEETTNLNDDYRIQHYGQMRLYSPSNQYRDFAGEYSDTHTYLRAGKSNAEDGYLIFEIPKSSNLNNTLALGDFGKFGSSQWRLKND